MFPTHPDKKALLPSVQQYPEQLVMTKLKSDEIIWLYGITSMRHAWT